VSKTWCNKNPYIFGFELTIWITVGWDISYFICTFWVPRSK